MKKKTLTPNSDFVTRTKARVLLHYAQEYPAPQTVSISRILFGSLAGTFVCASLIAFVYSRIYAFDVQLNDLQTDIESVSIPQEQFDTAL